MTLDFNAAGGDALLELTFNQRGRYPYVSTPTSRHPAQPNTMAPSQQRWSMPVDLNSGGTSPMSSNSSDDLHQQQQQRQQGDHSQHQTPSPVQSSASPHSQHSDTSPFVPAPSPLTDWALQQQQQQQQLPSHDFGHFMQESTLLGFGHLVPNFQPNPLDYLPATTQAALHAALPLESTFNHLSSVDDAAAAAAAQSMHWGGMGMDSWHDFQTTLPIDGLPTMGSNSPTGTYLEVPSLPSSSGEGWHMVDFATPNFQQNPAIFNPSQTLHLRTNSDSSDGTNSMEFGSFEEVAPFPYSPFSPDSDSFVDSSHSNHGNHRNCYHGEAHVAAHHQHPQTVSPTVAVGPTPIKASPPASTRSSPSSGSGATSPSTTTTRRNSGPRKSPIAKATKPVIRRSSTGKKDGTGEKKVGRRRGPLLPEQRKQASEIRKLRACLRCKFLKKTCDKGEPCAGCQPSHARLWQVPCTRIDIKDVGYFMKDWKADYERHMSRGVSVFNVKGFSPVEHTMWITHGYGFALPITVREVYVADDSCFQLDWVESCHTELDPIDFDIQTERLDVGHEGIPMERLSEYLDKHIDVEGKFEQFITDHFEGTPFVTEILQTAHRYYAREKSPVIRKALKLVLAYNLTLHITLIESQGAEVQLEGTIDDEDSKFYGQVVAPVMVNFQIKCAMADMWRELQKDILEELSALYSSVYSGERLKNWPTIFMLASILLAVWEEMQFDCHYRVPDPIAVNKFCTDMETIPVGVIIGLFHAISQKLPAFTDWDTEKHGHILNNNPAVCDAMTEVRQHVIKHESYLRTRPDTKFDHNDFDSLSNKFLSKLVIRAN